MPSLRGLNQDEKDREELAIFVAKQMENFVFPHHHHRDIPTTNFKENNGPQIAGRHEEKAAEAGAANATGPVQPFITQHQAAEGAPSDSQPAVYRPRPGVDVDRQALYNQWAFTSRPHTNHQAPRREAEPKATDCGAATEQLASKIEVPPSKAMSELNLGQDPKGEHMLLETEAKDFEKVELEEDMEYEMVDIHEDASPEKTENEEAEMGDWEEI